ncbi:uncharacterized protein LOC128092544 [Culex pipiens pallens]|uniref:uncharacterized protein LOC128092544 n=1 Tax=Culex pipiens pallens TaxID=42434 RepID=UPI0022A9FEF6|nr:uncharacterized protein LOC128092544 [Culex pipiens pallens]
MNRSTKIQEKDLTGHLEVLKNFNLNPALNSIVDWMPTKANYNIPFTVDAKSRYEWDNGGPNLRPGSIEFYTDGSKMNNNTGAGVYGPGIKKFIPMGHYPTVFQAEVYAIVECACICLKRNYRFTNICIFSDSLAALNSLKGYTCQSRLVWEGVNLLKQLSQNNVVNLYWVPGHCGILGNEIADSLARKGSETDFIGPEPFFGVPDCSMKMELKIWELSTVKFIWNTTDTSRQAKRFIFPNEKSSRELLKLDKKNFRVITGLLTGHCPCKYHLFNMGKTADSICRFCQMETETSEHLLCSCGALIQSRISIFGKGVLQPSDIIRFRLGRVIDFIKKVDPNWDKTQ